MDTKSTIAFEVYEVDPIRRELRRNSVEVSVEPQVFDLIECFARHPGEVLSREELIEHVWSGRIVSDSAIASRINAARTALGDDGNAQRLIRTIPRRGFRFEGLIRGTEVFLLPVLPEKPSVAVLPFVNMSNDPEQAYFSDGITDDIITDLSRYDELFVIARQSSFFYRGREASIAQISGELGVQYILEGSVRRSGSRVRVTTQLVDARSGIQLWADRYDRDLVDIFAVQEEITTVIVNTLAGQIAHQHYMRIQSKSSVAIDAYEHLAKATPHALKISRQDNMIAREDALKAISIDPTLARAHAILSLTYTNEANNFWIEDPSASQRAAYEASRIALAADARDPWAHATHGIADLWMNRAHDRAVHRLERAVELNPSNAYFRALYSYILPFAGEAGKALEEIEQAHRMNPHFPAVFMGFRGRALLCLRRLDEALSCLEEMVTMMPGHSNALGYVAVAYAALGRQEEARKAAKHLTRENPFYTQSKLRQYLPFRKATDLDFMMEMLELADLPN